MLALHVWYLLHNLFFSSFESHERTTTWQLVLRAYPKISFFDPFCVMVSFFDEPLSWYFFCIVDKFKQLSQGFKKISTSINTLWGILSNPFVFLDGNSIPFCNAIFRTFGGTKNKTGQYLEFKEFLSAMNITSLNTEEVNNIWQRLYFIVTIPLQQYVLKLRFCQWAMSPVS